MRIVVTIQWDAPGDVPAALAAIRKQNEALRVREGDGYRVLSVEMVAPRPRSWSRWWRRERAA